MRRRTAGREPCCADGTTACIDSPRRMPVCRVAGGIVQSDRPMSFETYSISPHREQTGNG
ncbi:hypothetical protein OH687_10140 [Burkholderia anthina]|nr:hypothetical protein OH687_10140 [Burkholderia anthina]